jgi:hypothetical protein
MPSQQSLTIAKRAVTWADSTVEIERLVKQLACSTFVVIKAALSSQSAGRAERRGLTNGNGHFVSNLEPSNI